MDYCLNAELPNFLKRISIKEVQSDYWSQGPKYEFNLS